MNATTTADLPDAPLALSQVEKLGTHHDVRKFRSGKHSLDYFLKRHALKNQDVDSSQTYVVHRGGGVVAYYTLTYGEVHHTQAPDGVRAGMPEGYKIPVMVLGRLAIDQHEQRTGLGKALLKDAFVRTVSAAEIAGLRAVLVHALDEEAKAFYKHFGFHDCPTGHLQLMISIQDIRVTMGAGDTP